MLLGMASASEAEVSVGVVIGAPPPPRVVVVIPAQPAPECVWVEGYWYPVGKHYKWHGGYWTRPPYGEPAGSHRTMTANDSIWVTGKEAGAVWNTFTAGIMIETVTTTITTNMVITTTTGTSDKIGPPVIHPCRAK
jgi:hypothetical protein